jgi:hypothetical protein
VPSIPAYSDIKREIKEIKILASDGTPKQVVGTTSSVLKFLLPALKIFVNRGVKKI